MRANGNGDAIRSPAGWSWRLHAACRGADASVLFGGDGERPGRREVRERRAKEICAVCPVVEPCRLYALTHGESFGVWGGLGERERREIRHAADAPAVPVIRGMPCLPRPVRTSRPVDSSLPVDPPGWLPN